MAGIIDPTVDAKYPVILGDGLIGKTPDEIFTGVNYNHKPTNLPSGQPEHIRLKPALPGSTTSFDLSYSDDSGKYAFAGTRNTKRDQYVLYFDTAKEAFILDRIDSTFDMNLTRLPNNSDPNSLCQKYPHIGISLRGTDRKKENEYQDAGLATKNAPKVVKRSPLTQPKRKQERKVSKTDLPSMSKISKPKSKINKVTSDPEDLDDEDDEDDDALLIEYPDGNPNTKTMDFSPAFPSVRRFDDFMDARESEGDDADGESEDEPEDLRLPSPVNHETHQESQDLEGEMLNAMDVDETVHEVDDSRNIIDDGDDDDNDVDLEKELENAFDDMENSNQGTPLMKDHDESEISEED